jgi:hypothetical protein
MTASGFSAAKTASSAVSSETSIRCSRGERPAMPATRSSATGELLAKLSTTMTSSPRSRRVRIVWDPM